MSTKRVIKNILLAVILLAVAYGVMYAWQALPIISGYGAKNLCSCVMVGGREPDDVLANELGRSPLNLGKFTVDYKDSTVTGTVFGLAQRTAAFKKGLGCTLLINLTVEEYKAKLLNTVQTPVVDAKNLRWPLGDKDAVDSTSKADMKRVNAALDEAFSEPGPERLRRTRAVVVVHKGKIIAERYAEGFDASSKLIGWSMTKSLTNAMVGVLVKDRKLDISQPAPVESWNQDYRKDITLSHLLQASSGLDWEENYAGPSGATNMLFKEMDMGSYAAESKLAETPGEFFEYSSGTTNIISKIVRETAGVDYYKFPYERILHKIGMFNTIIEPDASGTFVGSSYSYGPARDWARFGLLYLNDGVFNGERILPEGWVKYTVTPAKGADRGQYGAQFWLNAGAPNDAKNRYYPDVPTDLFWADGFEGQNVFILPSSDLVVVKLSLSQGDYLDDNKFLSEIVAAVNSNQDTAVVK